MNMNDYTSNGSATRTNGGGHPDFTSEAGFASAGQSSSKLMDRRMQS
eukprot:CAMPEP_0176394808 /NCGR_PEP_ID=MMETSP0126-20121128/42885_1 /TAXON_ID=141414 ORGANISM="Strombidinopsis acuminatum, Strain SPMC142" /NCGR_SAMPLE_ID=MMETSP0126 /ASSEMBLY_ACC=CAM_ASM_000229 /LENGTH=46 /DNA_ID= /DNA_START= /DNA_END= /DNA_ORIENTATION=